MSSQRTQLTESVRAYPTENGKKRIDKERRVLYGVKILGLHSSNDREGRRYLPEAIRQAAPLYEGVAVRKDHPDKPTDNRSVSDTLGWLKNVRVGSNGCLYGDLHYLDSHPYSKQLVETAERNPNLIGLSHNADGDCRIDERGVTVVREIIEVRSVDLVDCPATTFGLFESRQRSRQFDKPTSPTRKPHNIRSSRGSPMARYTLLEWFDRTRLLPRDRRTIKSLIERKFMEADMPMDLPPEEAPMDTGMEPESAEPVMDDPADMPPEEALKMGFSKALEAVVNDTTMPEKDALRRVKELITTRNRLISSGQEVPEAEEPEEDSEDVDDAADLGGEAIVESDDKDADDKDGESIMECDEEEEGKKSMKESRTKKPGKGKTLLEAAERKELTSLRTEKAVRELCESEGFTPSSIQLESLCGLSGEDKRREFILEAKSTQPRGNRPRTTNTQQTTSLTESRQNGSLPSPAAIKDGDLKAFSEFLKN